MALFLLTCALHYLLMAVAASQEAERRALEFEVASREAELRALRAQIHPHFLFNSLNSINALIAARPEDARRLCVRLGDFLRRSLTLGSRETIPLAEELDLAEQLLSIERARFGDRLSHVVVADDAARACAVPPLLLQPLVENAVTHGVAQMIDGGEIRIEAERRGEELRIAITNPRDSDSPGRKGTGIGLQNVRRRLAALHGDAAEVRTAPAGRVLLPRRAAPARAALSSRGAAPGDDAGRKSITQNGAPGPRPWPQVLAHQHAVVGTEVALGMTSTKGVNMGNRLIDRREFTAEAVLAALSGVAITITACGGGAALLEPLEPHGPEQSTPDDLERRRRGGLDLEQPQPLRPGDGCPAGGRQAWCNWTFVAPPTTPTRSRSAWTPSRPSRQARR